MRNINVCRNCSNFRLDKLGEQQSTCRKNFRSYEGNIARISIIQQFEEAYTNFNDREIPEYCPYKLEHIVIGERNETK